MSKKKKGKEIQKVTYISGENNYMLTNSELMLI